MIIQELLRVLVNLLGRGVSSSLISVTVPLTGAYRSETAFTDSTVPKLLPCCDLRADFRQLDEDDVAERVLRVVGDADGAGVAVEL